MSYKILKKILKVINYFKLKFCCCCFEANLKSEIGHLQQIYQNCSDRPYSILSFEILVQIRKLKESTRDPTEKAYLKLLEGFVKILDYLCHANSRSLLIKYIDDINLVSITVINSI